MSAVHFHIVFTHAVVVTTILGVLILAWALLRKNHDIRTLGLIMILAGGLLAIPVFLTGESAEEVVEELGVSHDIIHEHEESAELTFIGLEVLAAAALLALLISARRKSTGQGAAIGVLILGIIVSILVARTSNLGGEVRHSEIRSGTVAAEPAEQGGEGGEEHEDEH